MRWGSALSTRTTIPAAGMFQALHLGEGFFFGSGSVFQVDQDPIEARQAHNFRGQGAAQIEPTTVQGFTVLKSFF
nr:hypothetical protein [Haliscomenobacter sp.]